MAHAATAAGAAAATAAGDAAAPLPLVPLPASVTRKPGSFTLDARTHLQAPAALRAVAERFRDDLTRMHALGRQMLASIEALAEFQKAAGDPGQAAPPMIREVVRHLQPQAPGAPAAAGEILVDRAALARLLPQVAREREAQRDAQVQFEHLTEREREILGLLAQGLRNDDIAARLYISPQTVQTHVRNLLAKLGVHSKLEAVAFAVRHGMVAV
jgi:DNA-binding CsgD family transcriptional regulator